ncbi:hypothetical protein D3C84_1259240 [compost metagenome]
MAQQPGDGLQTRLTGLADVIGPQRLEDGFAVLLGGALSELDADCHEEVVRLTKEGHDSNKYASVPAILDIIET